MSHKNFDRQGFSVWVEKRHKGGWQAGVLAQGHPHLGGIVRATPLAAMRAAIKLACMCGVEALQDIKGISFC